uniref:TIL domain-containing protein n=1 Tax=Panagrellus redivivus TaxID=6233 RepID=A0A7E4W033_PANRE
FSRTADGECVPDSECPAVSDTATALPTATPLTDPCMTVRCTATTECVALETLCLQPPCPQRAQCVFIDRAPEAVRVVRNAFKMFPNAIRAVRSAVEAATAEAKTCGVNEVYETCGYCEGTCDDRHPDCPSTACEKPGCYCPRGFVRDRAGRCVHEVVCDPTW